MRDYWAGRGACRDHDPDIWFPTTTDPADAETAKLICSTCVVRWSCLESALQRREEHGVWGGFTTRERNVILRHRLRGEVD
jgi:WhiB family redox-sensing transcriptional regulator